MSTMKALRPPLAASPVTYLVRFRCPRDSSAVRARCCQRSRAAEVPRIEPGSLFDRRSPLPVHSHVDVSGTSQIPRRPILCLCPGPRPRPSRRSSPLTEPAVLPLPTARQRLQRDVNFEATAGLWHLLSTLQERCYHRHMQDSLPAGWLAFAGRELNPLDRDERFPSCYISFPFPGFTLTLPDVISDSLCLDAGSPTPAVHRVLAPVSSTV